MRQDMGRECSTHGRNTRHIKCLLVIYKGRGYLEVAMYECNKTILEKKVRVWLTLDYAIIALPLKFMRVYVA